MLIQFFKSTYVAYVSRFWVWDLSLMETDISIHIGIKRVNSSNSWIWGEFDLFLAGGNKPHLECEVPNQETGVSCSRWDGKIPRKNLNVPLATLFFGRIENGPKKRDSHTVDASIVRKEHQLTGILSHDFFGARISTIPCRPVHEVLELFEFQFLRSVWFLLRWRVAKKPIGDGLFPKNHNVFMVVHNPILTS